MSANPELAQFKPHITALRLGYGYTIEQAQAVVQSGLGFIEQLPPVQSCRGEFLCREGQPAEAIRVLQSGHVMIYRFNQQSGKHSDQMASPFSVIGASILHGRENYDYSTVVVTDTCVTRSIPTRYLALIFTENPKVSLFLHADHEVQLAKWNERFWMWRTMSVPQRLARVLIDILAIKDTFPLEYLTQETLAGLAGATRESASVVLKALNREGVLYWRRSHSPKLLDEDRLNQICRGELDLKYRPPKAG